MQAVLLVLHIVAAGIWLGTGVAQSALMALLRKSPNATRAAFHRAVATLGRRLYGPAGVTVLVTGIFLVLLSNDAFRFSDTFVGVGVAAVIIGGVLGSVFFAPSSRKTAELFDQGSPAAAASEDRIRRVAVIDSFVIVIAIIAMVQHWGV